MSAARTLSGNTAPCVSNRFIFNKLEAGGVEQYTTTHST